MSLCDKDSVFKHVRMDQHILGLTQAVNYIICVCDLTTICGMNLWLLHRGVILLQ